MIYQSSLIIGTFLWRFNRISRTNYWVRCWNGKNNWSDN